MNSFYPQEQVQLRIPFLFYLILILNIFCINQSNAQNKCTKKVGYFSSRNAEKLANQLTKDLDDDKDKVEAIHCWITHHIKYDISKGQKYVLFDGGHAYALLTHFKKWGRRIGQFLTKTHFTFPT
jgi:hypothetical protein